MILYHGSNVKVERPRLLKPERRLDFGNGFYLTSSYEQAERWAQLTTRRRGAGKPLVSSYDCPESGIELLQILYFEGATPEWLSYVGANRLSKDVVDDWDIVIGPVANDTTMPTLRLFFANLLTVEQAIESLMPQNLKDQYAFKTQEAIDLLEFREAIEA